MPNTNTRRIEIDVPVEARPFEHGVDQARFGRAEDAPRHARHQRRREQRQDACGCDKSPERRVGSHHDPGKHQPDHHRDQGAAAAGDQRVGERLGHVRIGQHRDEVGDGEMAQAEAFDHRIGIGQRAQQQCEHGIDNEEGQDRQQQRHPKAGPYAAADEDLRKQLILLFEENDKLKQQLALKKKESAKDIDALISIGKEHSSFFCDDAAYAVVVVNGQRKTYKVESRAYANWLRYEFRLAQEKAATGSEIKTAILQLAADAEFEPLTPKYQVQLRTAEVDGCIYIDLGDDLGQCIEVNDTGWGFVEAPETVQFRRTSGMQALPVPERGGSIELLRPFTNLTDNDFRLFVPVLLDAFRQGRHPILNLVGEHATAKSTLAKIFKKLVDPDGTELRGLPNTVEDMFVAVDNARVRAWDNISKITPTISNALCQLSDGSGFGRRKRYTDSDEYSVQGSPN